MFYLSLLFFIVVFTTWLEPKQHELQAIYPEMQREAQSNKAGVIKQIASVQYNLTGVRSAAAAAAMAALQQLRIHKQAKQEILITLGAPAYLLRGISDSLALQFIKTCSLILTT